MFKNYFQIAWRNLVKDKLYSFINIMGLAIGLTACMLLALFINDETSFDHQWPDAERIHRMQVTFKNPGGESPTYDEVPGQVKLALESYFSEEIEVAARLNRPWPILTTENDIYEEPIYLVDPEILKILQFEVLLGDLNQTLNDNASIALSEELAIKYYGTVDALDKVITIDGWGGVKDYKVGAVYKNLPHNTSIESLTAMAKIVEEDFAEQPWMFESWGSANNMTLVKLKSGVSIENINTRLVDFVEKKAEFTEFWLGRFDKITDALSFDTVPMVDYYMEQPGRKTNIAIFMTIALVILSIACINFTNLSIAKSTRRAKEVALRKVVGASRKQLVIQFLGETIFITFIALILSLVLLEISLPYYSQFLERDFMFNYSLMNLSAMLALVIFVGVIGGIYPAFVLSGFRPAAVLKANKSAETSGSLMLRNLLVVLQFAISIALIICSIVIYTQRLHAMNMELGYDKEQLVILHGVGRNPVSERQQLLQDQVTNIPGVLSATYIHLFPATNAIWDMDVNYKDAEGNDKNQQLQFKTVDEGYPETFSVELLAGRYFQKEIAQDVMPSFRSIQDDPRDRNINILINQTAVNHFGYGTSATNVIGQEVVINVSTVKLFATVIGVLEDTNYRSVREVIQPEIYAFDEFGGFLAVKFTGSPSKAEQKLKSWWKQDVPELPFVRTFVGELIERDFQAEEKRAQLLAASSSLAVIVSCLGLFGLASFAAERRIKEIGVRKVMGAGVLDIVKLLTWQFSKPVLIACVIGCTGASLLMFNWLQDFPYRIGEHWILIACLISSGIAIGIAWLTIGGKAARVAQAKPIKALRYE